MDVVVELENGLFGIIEDAHDLDLEGNVVECWVEKNDQFILQESLVKQVI